MKIPEKKIEKKGKTRKNEIIKPKKEQVLIVAQEIKFARLLSGNEKKNRDKVLKTLKKWLLNCFQKKYEFREDDFVRMWKGLFYAVWMSDKPLVQEELCENISGVLDLFPPEDLKHALLMYKAGLRVLATEWYGVDHHRMDKFLMLVRRYMRASLRCLAKCDWSLDSCRIYTNIISGNDGILAVKTPHYARNATSMLLHILDCYLEEIAKVSMGAIPPESLSELLRPVCRYMCSGEQPILASASRRVLTALLRQSEHGLKYQHATQAWQKMGCPEGGPEALELISDDEEVDADEEQNEDDNNEEHSSAGALDPRAGRVDVELPLLPVPADMLADMLRDMLANTNSKAHKRVRICLQRFEQLARDEYPLRIKTNMRKENSPTREVKPKKVAQALQVLEKKLVIASDEFALRGLSRKHRKRLLAKSRSGMSIVDDVQHLRQKIINATIGKWQVEPTDEPKPEKNNKRKNEVVEERRALKRHKTQVQKCDKINHSKVLQVNSEEYKEDRKINKDGRVCSSTNNIKNTKKCANIVKNISKNEVKNVLNGKTKHRDKSKKNINKSDKMENSTKNVKSPTVLVNNINKFEKLSVKTTPNKSFDTPKKVKFALKNNSMQAPTDYYKSIRQSPNIPFDGNKKPSRTNLKPSTPSPINPFFKKKLKLKR